MFLLLNKDRERGSSLLAACSGALTMSHIVFDPLEYCSRRIGNEVSVSARSEGLASREASVVLSTNIESH